MRAASFSLLLPYVAAAAEAATGLTLLIYPKPSSDGCLAQPLQVLGSPLDAWPGSR
jgi:hypothetical protein